eukprot:29843-Pelagococcus_subviridis.AAC.5
MGGEMRRQNSVLKDRRSPRRRGRMGTSVKENAPVPRHLRDAREVVDVHHEPLVLRRADHLDEVEVEQSQPELVSQGQREVADEIGVGRGDDAGDCLPVGVAGVAPLFSLKRAVTAAASGRRRVRRRPQRVIAAHSRALAAVRAERRRRRSQHADVLPAAAGAGAAVLRAVLYERTSGWS